MDDGNQHYFFLLLARGGEHGSSKIPIFRDLKTPWTGLFLRKSVLDILGMMGNELEATGRNNNLSHSV